MAVILSGAKNLLGGFRSSLGEKALERREKTVCATVDLAMRGVPLITGNLGEGEGLLQRDFGSPPGADLRQATEATNKAIWLRQ